MAEHRRATRKRTSKTVEVTNAITGERVGRIGNLSVDGMMLVSHKLLPEDSLFQFQFQLPDTLGRAQTMEVGVHEQWSESANVPGQFLAGFRIIDIAQQDQTTLARWLANPDNQVV